MEKKRDSFFLPNKKQKQSNPGKFQKHEKGQENALKQKFKPRSDQQQEFKKKRQDNFNEDRNGLEIDQEKEGKKPFDKKTYRLKKYSKKYKLEQWEEQRKKKLLRNFYKDVKNDETAGTYKQITFEEDTIDSGQVGKYVRHPDIIEIENSMHKSPEIKRDPFRKAIERYNKIKQDKLDKKQEIEKAKEERKQKLREYKKQKQERFKKLSKKNKKGQPAMTGRLELLLEKIQKG